MLASKNALTLEGHIGWAMNRAAVMDRVVSQSKPCLMAQSGFNAGHSACLLLEKQSRLSKLISFTKKHPHDSRAAKTSVVGEAYVKKHWPHRHTIIGGDSQKTIPLFVKSHASLGRVLDLVFVDGGHSFKCAYADLQNFAQLARPRCVVIMDDVCDQVKHCWQKGPTKAWKKALDEGMVIQHGSSQDLVWGRFVTKG